MMPSQRPAPCLRIVLAASIAMLTVGCAAKQPHDYTEFRARMPRSILVLPPRNESIEVGASYSYLSTVTAPLAEAGYYVFPVAVIDQFLKDNGMPTPDEMHNVSLAKVREILGADAVLYITITQWGQKYIVIQSTTIVSARATLKDVATGTTLWEGSVTMQEGSGGGSDPIAILIAAALEQIVDTATDRAHDVARLANYSLVYNPQNGLLFGPRSPKYESDSRGR